MKKSLIHILSSLTLLVTVLSCNSTENSNQPLTATGRVIETSCNYLSIATNEGDTLVYSTFEIDKSAFDKVFIEDSIIVTYNYCEGIATVKDIVVINHNLPFLNNISAMLVGVWNINDTTSINVPNKLVFNTDSTLELHRLDNKELIKWYTDGTGIKMLDNNQTNNIKVLRVDDKQLTLEMSKDNIVCFKRASE